MSGFHVLILPSWYPAHAKDIGGSFFREQAIALAKHGHKVGVISPKLRSLRQWRSIIAGPYGTSFEMDENVATFRANGMNLFPKLREAQLWQWLRAGRKLFERYVAEFGRPDLIHVHSMLNAGLLAREIQQREGIPYIVTEHSTAFARNLLSVQQLSMAKLVASMAARRLAVSEPFCDLLGASLGTEAGRWEAVPNVVSNRFFEQTLRSVRRFGSSPRRKFQFIGVALLTEKKGVHNLIRAFAEAFKDASDIELVIGGDGPERPKLQNIARQLGVAERVLFLGSLSRDQVVEAIQAADAFVLASRYETFGVVVIEALALGKPVIATRCGGPESIVQEEDGVLVPVDDVAALAKAMRQVQENVEVYTPEVLRERCRARYSEAAVVALLSSIYRSVLGDPSELSDGCQ